MLRGLALTAVVIVVIVVVIAAVLLFANVLSPAIQNTTLSSSNSISSMFTAAQSLYNSSGPFNDSYAFFVNDSAFNGSNSFLAKEGINGNFQIARYGNSIRASLAYSTPYPYILFNASVELNEKAVSIYNGADLILCLKQSFTNESPVNATVEGVITTVDQKPMNCTSTAMPIPPFNMANSFTTVPFSMLNSPQASNFNFFTGGGSVTFLGDKTYLGQSCSMERLTPPPNAAGSAGVSFEDCISSTNGLPLYLVADVNGSTFMDNTISAINPAPSGNSVVTTLPPGAVLA